MRTSKTQSIKSLLLQAWRERWSDVTWGIRIKSVLPRGVSGDVYDLADCILQQALVGPAPNSLFMSYLIHSLSSKIISYGSVLSSIGRYQSFYKPYCILSLLDLLKTFQSRIGCHGNEEECIALCKAVVSVTHWLYSCICHSITKLSELKQSPEHVSIIEKSYDALFYFSNSTFIKSLLHVGKFEDHVMYSQMLQKHQDLEEKLNQIPNITNVSKEIIESILGLPSSVDNLPSDHISKNNDDSQFSASTLNIIVSIDAILNPANDVTTFVNQLFVVKKLQNFKLSQLYSEIIRASLIGIIDSTSTFEDALKWFAFTFLKLPNLIYKIHTAQVDNEEDAFIKGLDMLLYNSRILNLTDLKSNFDSLQCLITKFCKVQVLTEAQACNWVTQRQNDVFVPSHSNGMSGQSIKSPTTKPSPQCGQASVPLILRADHTVSTILKTLETDYAKVQQALLGVLCQILPLRNFKLMLAAAAATGRMHIFISKLIDCNEHNKYVASETVAASQIRALMFDVTFILLCYTCQYYGVDVVVGHASNKDSFFIQWVTNILAENGKFKCPKSLVKKTDKAISDMLLDLFINSEQELKTHQVKWDEICINAPVAVREVLIAWEHGAFSNEKVKVILDHIKSQFCFLPVCISAWLCNNINIFHYETRLKPMNMLQHFITPPVELVASPDESPSGSDRKTPQTPGMEQSNGHYVGRCKLMNGIVKLMMFHLHPPQQAQAKIAPVVPHGLTVKTPLLKILRELFSDMHCQGWVDVNSIHYFDTLLCVGGAQWFCDALVRLMLGYQSLHDINRAVDMIFGLFHLDIEQCALVLLLQVIPFYLGVEVYPEKLVEPYTTALSRLAAITTYSALQSRQFSSNSRIKTGTKRSIHAVDIDTKDHSFELNKSSKIHRTNAELLEDTPFELLSLSDEQMHNAIDNPINKAIATLMRKLVIIASEDTISARSYFPIRFLEQIVLCAKDQASMILQFMPLGLVELLLKKYPEEFSHELVLAVSSMQSARARKVAALSLCHLTIAHNQLVSRLSQSWIEL